MGGEALGPVLDTFEFDSVVALTPWAIHLDGEYYAVVYKRSDASLWLKTYHITSAGVISEIDTWEITTVLLALPRIFKVSGTMYAMAWGDHDGTKAVGYIKTITISNTGVITKSFHDTETKDYEIRGEFVINLQGSYFGIIPTVGINYQELWTCTISPVSGIITNIEHAYVDSIANDVYAIGKVTSNIVFQIVSETDAYTIMTSEVSGTGTITTAQVDKQAFNISKGSGRFNIVKVSSNIWAIAIRNSATSVVTIQTFQINDNGTIEASLIDTYTFGNVLEGNIGFFETGIERLYFVAWAGAGNDGLVDIVEIDTSGNISDAGAYEALEFDIVSASNNKPLTPNNDVFPIFYTDPNNYGFVKSITFKGPAAEGHHEMIMKMGP